MLSPKLSTTWIQPVLSRLLILWVTAALLAGLAFNSKPAAAVTAAAAKAPATGPGTTVCTSQVEEGDWADPATWDCPAVPGTVPGAATDVIIATTVKVTLPAAARNLTILQSVDQSGVLRLDQPVTLSIAGDFDVQGTFDDHVGGTVTFNGATSQTITTNGAWVDFSNLTKNATPCGDTLLVDPYVTLPEGTFSGGLNVYGTLTLQGSAGCYLNLRSTVPGSPWQINSQAPAQRVIDYVDVQDSYDASDTPISVAHWVDSGGNTGWGLVNTTVTSVTLQASETTVYSGLPVTFTATLSPSTDSGTVAFQDNGTDIPGCASQTVSTGQTSCTTSDLAVGSHSITAVYSAGGTSGPVVVDVDQFAGVMLTSSLNPSLAGANVTFKAMVMPMTATDRVTFNDNGSPISGCVDLALSIAGEAFCVTNSLTVDPQGHEITVVYTGSTTFPNGNSDSLVQRVKNASSIWVSSSQPESLRSLTVTFTAVVTPSSADGTVTFKDNGIDIPGCTAVPFTADAPATCSTSQLIAATHPITAVYSGSSTYVSSLSAPVTQIIDRPKIYLPAVRR